ncbi:MAG: DUF4340 domain-containing protein [Deltaproteobacteria bacterium]|nr:DUF4340 domain-containing protein [Deltaproteobacteria bacterium]
MNKQTQILAGVLLLQLALAGWMLSRTETTADFSSDSALMALNQDQVSQILLEEKDGENLRSLELVKKDGQWVLPETHDFPVSSDKISGFLTKMAGFRKSWPAGKTDIAAKQFKVTDEQFERRLSFTAGDKKQVLFLGGSPGFKKIYARPEGDMQTYSITFSAYEASLSYKDWMDRQYLNLERTDVSKVLLDQLAMENSGGDFLVKDPGEDMETIRSKTSALVSGLLKPRYNDVAGLQDQVKKGQQVLSLRLVKQDGQELVYTWYRDPAEVLNKADAATSGEKQKPEDLILTVSGKSFAFRVKEATIEDLINASKHEFIRQKDPNQAEESAGSDNQGAAVESGENVQNLPADDEDAHSFARAGGSQEDRIK